MTTTYDEDSPLAKLCEVCSYLVDRLDDVVQEVETGENQLDKILYPHSLSHRAFFSNAKNGCGICTHLVEDLDEEELEEMSTRDKTEGMDCKFQLRLEFRTNSSNPNLSVTKTVISVLFWLEVDELDDLLAVKRAWRRAASMFYITFYSFKHELYCIHRITIRTVNRPKHANSTGSTRALSFADEWLSECVTTHPKCRHSFALRPPTRLIELRRDSGCQLYEFKENDPFPVYATLSHCCMLLEFPVVARGLFLGNYPYSAPPNRLIHKF
jgi:hypothetical protein